MNCYYDFHIHTALSPCGDNDMTPNNIVNMAYLKGLDAIAVTDHNSVKNAAAVMEVGAAVGITVIPGMEIETSEEVHVIALFSDLKGALEAEARVLAALPAIKNKPEIFGEQLIFDSDDNIIRREEQMLITATALDLFTVFDMVRGCGGAAYPAHIDRHSYSVLSNLGFIPAELNSKFVEISGSVDDPVQYLKNKAMTGYGIVRSSDAHYLENISERENFISVLGNSAKNILKYFI